MSRNNAIMLAVFIGAIALLLIFFLFLRPQGSSETGDTIPSPTEERMMDDGDPTPTEEVSETPDPSPEPSEAEPTTEVSPTTSVSPTP